MTLFRAIRGATKADIEAADHAISLLMQGICLHAVEGDSAEYGLLRDQIQACISSFETDPAQSRMIATGSVLKLMEQYNRHTTRFFKQRALEQQKMIGDLTKTIIGIGAANPETAEQMGKIAKALERAPTMDHLRDLTKALERCLECVRSERDRQASESAALVGKLRERLDSIADTRTDAERAFPVLHTDPVTELPGPTAAREALRIASEDPRGIFLGVFVPRRIRAINLRFGHVVGDHILNAMRDHLRSSLSKADRLYRWRGPCLLIVLERDETLTEIRDELTHIANTRIEKTVEIGNRHVLLPVSTAWDVLTLTNTMDDIESQIDDFVAAADLV